MINAFASTFSKHDTPFIIQEHKLRYITDSTPGFTRKKDKGGFTYLYGNNKRITDPKVLERIFSLGIPPAWKDVWISPYSNGHIQATGRDEKDRKQYIYHLEWQKISQQNKFHKTVIFGNLLPIIRETINKDISLPGLSQRKILATVIWLLETTYIRIGNEEYAKENRHFGLTTFQNHHVSLNGSLIKFHYIGKSGKEHTVEVTHHKIAKIIQRLEEIPGYELFKYIDDKGIKHPIHSEEVNEYLASITHQDITAKDFRTWGGSVFAAETLYHRVGTFQTQRQAKQYISTTVKAVAKYLRNTPAVSRSYYIHPTIFATYTNNILLPHFKEYHSEKNPIDFLSIDETATLKLLEKYQK